MDHLPRTLLVLVVIGVGTILQAAPPPSGKGPSARLQALLDAAGNTARDREARREAAREAISLARTLGDRRAEAEATHDLGSLLFEEERLGDALEKFHEARRLFEAAGDHWGLSRSYRRIGDVNYRLGGYELAMEALLKSLEELGRIPEPGPVQRLAAGHIHVMIGNVVQKTGALDQALEEFRRAAGIYEREGYTLGRAGVALNIGNVFFERDRFEEALVAYETARSLAADMGNEALRSMALTNLASSWTELGRYRQAREALTRSEEICRRIGRKRGLLHNAVELGDLEHAMGNDRRALAAYREALSLAEELGDRHTQAELHRNLATVLEALGRYREANAHLRTRQELLDRFLDAAKVSNVARLRIAYEASARERELELLRQKEVTQRTANRLLRIALLLAAVLVLGLGVLARVKSRAAETVARKNRELEEAYREVERLSRTDELTGLANRRDAVERLEREIRASHRENRPFVLALADLDGFKLVNDRHGHQAGDRVLMAFAQEITSVIRAQDYAARLGGDEILLLLPGTSAEVGHALADRIRRSVERIGRTLGIFEVPLTTSIGIVEGTGGDVEAWLRLADRALYAAKSRGKNRTVILRAGHAEDPDPRAAPGSGPS